jgi:hypothetical protein
MHPGRLILGMALVLAGCSASDPEEDSASPRPLSLLACDAPPLPANAESVRSTPDGALYVLGFNQVARFVPRSTSDACAFDADLTFGTDGFLDFSDTGKTLAVDAAGYLHIKRAGSAGTHTLFVYDPLGQPYATCEHPELFLGSVVGVSGVGHTVFLRTFDGPIARLELGAAPCTLEAWNADARFHDAHLVMGYDNQLVIALFDALFVAELAGQPTAGPIGDSEIASEKHLCYAGDVVLRDGSFDVADPNCGDVKRYSLAGDMSAKFELPAPDRISKFTRSPDGRTYALTSPLGMGEPKLNRVEGLE